MNQGRLFIAITLGGHFQAASGAFVAPGRGAGRFFLDTASTEEYAALLPLGIFHGVTSNPSILQKDGVPCTVGALHILADRAFSYGVQEFMCQAWGGSTDSLVATGLALRAKDPARMVIKLPVTADGVEAARRLQETGTRICLTACYDHKQMLVAASAGVEYLAPYLGRMTDSGKDGFEECARMEGIARGLRSSTRTLVASIRDVESMARLAELGLDTYTFSPAIARALFEEPLTDSAASAFEEAARANVPNE